MPVARGGAARFERTARDFLDPVGAGTLARPRPTRAPGPRTALVIAAAPILAVLASVALVAATGLSRRSGLPEAIEPYAYGFFLDSYPLFAFALVYGIARLAAVAAGPGPGSLARRLAFGLAGAVVLCAAGLYPTFGGLILRAGYGIGGRAFLGHLPHPAAYGLGAAVAAGVFSGIVGAFALAANRPFEPTPRRLGFACLAVLALWFGAAVIGLARDLGFGPWPQRAMRPAEAGLAALLLAVAALPHAGSVFLRGRRAA